MVPKRLGLVLDGADGLSDRDDVLLVGLAVFAAADVVERIVAALLDALGQGGHIVKIGEVEALYAVAMSGEHGADFAAERPFGVEHDIARIHLQQVGLKNVVGLAGARRPDYEHIVVEARLTRITRECVGLRKDGGGRGMQGCVEVRHGRSPWSR